MNTTKKYDKDDSSGGHDGDDDNKKIKNLITTVTITATRGLIPHVP